MLARDRPRTLVLFAMEKMLAKTSRNSSESLKFAKNRIVRTRYRK
uniref:Uncharacterized protein n=1 Tax=Arundo donax TaxID=35708 RepID=A0A0A9ALV5_ARUDO